MKKLCLVVGALALSQAARAADFVCVGQNPSSNEMELINAPTSQEALEKFKAAHPKASFGLKCVPVQGKPGQERAPAAVNAPAANDEKCKALLERMHPLRKTDPRRLSADEKKTLESSMAEYKQEGCRAL